jgi:DNA-binding NtrC family response regulator
MDEYPKGLTVYERQVRDFKRQLLQVTLEAHYGNRTHAARALGLQRTYFLRLIRDFEIRVPHR